MKKLIIPIAIIVVLIVSFVVAVVARRESNRHDDAQAVQSESSVTSRKPSVSVPETKPETKAVVIEEEKDYLNEAAEEYTPEERAKREPFYTLYQDDRINTVCFEGTVRATSTVPDPATNDYDNCLYTLFVEIDSLLSEVSSDTDVSCEAIVTVPIMKDKTILQDNRFYPGDKVWCSCAEYDAMPQAVQEIQVSDDIQSYEHQQYYSFGIRKISAFHKGGNRNFAKRVITITPIQTLPEDESASAARKDRIKAEIARIDREVKQHGGSFKKWKEEYKTVIKKYKALSDKQYQGWTNGAFFAAGEGELSYKTQRYIDGILPYKKYLEEHNIDLIVVRIPTKWEFARCVLASDDFQDDPEWIEHYYECLKKDIEIIDPMPMMWEHRFDFPLSYFYNVSSEEHPFEGQAYIAAMALSHALKRYSYPVSDSPIQVEDYVFKTSDKRYFWPEGNDKYNPEENLSFKRVVRDGESLGGLSINTGSPFLFLSNSYFWYPRRTEGASVPTYTAFFIQHIPDWFYQNGSGTEMLRTLVTKREVLSKRRAVIMVGHPVFWRSRFPDLPKYIQDNVTSITLEKTLNLIDDNLIVSGKDLFTFTKLEDGSVAFEQKSKESDGAFQIKISIPPVKGKKTCMVRFNFSEYSFLTIDALLKSKKEIDTCSLAPFEAKLQDVEASADLFIPISNSSTNASFDFLTKSISKKMVLRNIELWYY